MGAYNDILEQALTKMPDIFSSKLMGKFLRKKGFAKCVENDHMKRFLQGHAEQLSRATWRKLTTEDRRVTEPIASTEFELHTFTDLALINELKRRGYTGSLSKNHTL